MGATPHLDARWPIWRDRVEAKLDEILPGAETAPERLHQAMRYATLGEAKRFRAALVYATGESLGGDVAVLDVPACAVELVHAFSLVHDDLPAMDDDDLRRGQPSCHIAFDEATAILAGDALQTLAFESIVGCPHSLLDNTARLRMSTELARAVGSRGMAGGQTLDLAANEVAPVRQALDTLHRMKTGALICASVTLGAIAANVDPSSLPALQQYANAVGLGFQIADDILDELSDAAALGRTQGKDRMLGKTTYLTLLGEANARAAATQQCSEANTALQGLLIDTTVLTELAQFAIQRSR